MFILKQGTRNNMNRKRDRIFLRNFGKLFGYKMAHMDTVDAVLREIRTEELETLKEAMVSTLLARKTLRPGRLIGKYYLIAVDATGISQVNEDDEGTLQKESKNGKKTFHRMVLEGKIVTPNGFAISINSEWIANKTPVLDNDKSKQDCEIKAFRRLAVKLKAAFPRFPICILVDSLYPSQPFFDTPCVST